MSQPKQLAPVTTTASHNVDAIKKAKDKAKNGPQAIALSSLSGLSLFHSPRRLKGQEKVVRPSKVQENIISTLELTTPEHKAVGDNLVLKMPNTKAGEPGQKEYELWPTCSKKFHFQALDSSLNNQCLSYGEINALAGDFYATYEPISGDAGKGHPCPEESKRRFLEAWKLLAVQPASVEETQNILCKDKEIESCVLKRYEHSGHQPSWVYATKMIAPLEQVKAFMDLTDGREGGSYGEKTYPGYLGILLNNFDHFGHDAHFAYATGHEVALALAVEAGLKKDANKLKVAYAMNAFAEHFLEDAFSAGHLRTPRRYLHGPSVEEYTYPFPDLCANLMHDEDNALGIMVRNKRNDTWRCVGDDYLYDHTPGAQETLHHLHCALQASANEIWDAYHTGVAQERDQYAALEIAPDPDSAWEPHANHLAPLYKLTHGTARERNWSSPWSSWDGKWELNRTDWSDGNYEPYISAYSFLRLKESGWWNYPLQLDKASPASTD